MTINANLGILLEDLDKQIEEVQSRVGRDKVKAMRIAIYVGVISAITTVCIGVVGFLPKEYEPFFGIVSLVASASTTVIAAWDGVFHHKKLWINAVHTLNELRMLELDLKHLQVAGAEAEQEQINALYERFKEILSANNDRWQKIRE